MPLLRRVSPKPGAQTTLVARSEGDLRELCDRLENAEYIAADLTEGDSRQGLIARAENGHGPVDVLINNAGIEMAGPFSDLDAEGLERIVALNALAPMELSRQAIPGMVDRGQGHIVNVSSLAGTSVLPGLVAYSATKAALTHFTAGLRADLRGLPIGTTVVEIGLVPETAMGAGVMNYGPRIRPSAASTGLDCCATSRWTRSAGRR